MDKSGTSGSPLIDGSVFAIRFEVYEQLGEGGTSKVFRARDLCLDRYVALKGATSSDENGMRDMLIEAQLMASADHPNIVRVHDLLVEGKSMVLVLQLIEGTNLRDRLAQGPLELNEALDIAIQIASGLMYLHARGIIHRDIKPENIMLTTEQGELVVKIIDLGIAKLVAHGRTLVEAGGRDAHTPGYLSPEQALPLLGLVGHKVDAGSDCYSCALTLFELITGRQLWPSVSMIAELASHAGACPTPNLDAVEHPGLRRLLADALAPRERRIEMSALLDRLKQLRTPPAAPVRHERRWVALGAVAGILAATACGLFLPNGTRAIREEPPHFAECPPTQDPLEPEIDPEERTITTDEPLDNTASEPAPISESDDADEALIEIGSARAARHACVPSTGRMTFRDAPNARGAVLATARHERAQTLKVHAVTYSKRDVPVWLLVEYERGKRGWLHSSDVASIDLGGDTYRCSCRFGRVICRNVTGEAQAK